MEEKKIALEQLPKSAEKMQEVLSQGKLLVLRARDDFMYILDGGDEYRMFSHTAGQYRAGRKVQPKSDEDAAMFEGAAQTVDLVFAVEFDPSMDIAGVLYSAEGAILQSYPMLGEEEKIDFNAPVKPKE